MSNAGTIARLRAGLAEANSIANGALCEVAQLKDEITALRLELRTAQRQLECWTEGWLIYRSSGEAFGLAAAAELGSVPVPSYAEHNRLAADEPAPPTVRSDSSHPAKSGGES